jgi:spore germination protein KC
MGKRIVSILLVLVILFSISGCWDAAEINELGFVLSVAIDKDGDKYKVTAQIAKPDTYSKTPSGGKAEEKPFWLISATGRSVFEAIRNMAVLSPRRIFWAHIKVIIIGETLAKNDIHDVLDFFTRNPELRLRTLVAVTPGDAGKILETVPLMEKDPATDLESVIDNKSLAGKGYRNMLKNFLEDYLDPSANPATSRIIISKNEGKPSLELSGAAVFRENKLAGWLDEQETKGLLWIKNDISSSIMVVKCPFDGRPVTVEIKSGDTSVQSSVENGIIHYHIKVKATCNLVEQGCTTDFSDEENLHKLEKVLGPAIQSDIRSTLSAAQNLRVDFLGFNEVLHRQHKQDWLQLSKNWPEAFSEATFAIDVQTDIPSLSVLARPLSPSPEHALENY